MADAERRERRSLRRRIYDHLDPNAWHRPGMSLANQIIVGLIIVAVVLAVAETEPVIAAGRWHFFELANFGFGAVFAVEYLVRLWAAAENDPAHPLRARWRFVRSFTAIVDLVTTLSSFVTVVGFNAAPFRLVRIMRIMRLARFGPVAAALHYLATAIKSRRYELLVTAGVALLVLLTGSTVLYWLEGSVQPDKFGSIPRSMWWAVITMTTIGYGDVYPITVAGKIAAGVMALAGVGVIAMPTGILAAAFSDAMHHRRPQTAEVIEEAKEDRQAEADRRQASEDRQGAP